MAQQTDPADQYRATEGVQGVRASSQDTYRPKGFSSADLTPPASSLSSVTAPPSTQPETITWGKYTGASTPGIVAAMNSGGSGQPGQTNQDHPLLDSFGKMALLGPAGLFWNTKPNNSQLQDIGGALYQGLPITDADWLRAGYGPGGTTLQSSAQPQTGLRSIVSPVLGAVLGPAAAAALQKQQQMGTIPSNATLNTF